MVANKSPANRRSGGARPLAATLPKITRQLLDGRGLAEADLLVHWSSIVGSEIAGRSLPRRLTFADPKRRVEGTLQLRVDGPWAVELIHLEPQLIERINGFFGYRAVAKLRVQQGPLPRAAASEPKPDSPLDPETEAQIRSQADDVTDPEIRAKLVRLGQAAMRRRPKDT